MAPKHSQPTAQLGKPRRRTERHLFGAPGGVALAAALTLSIVAFGGCASKVAPFRWAEDIPAGDKAPRVYRLGPDDVVRIQVWDHEAMSIEAARVRADGRISLPFLQDVNVQGSTPHELSKTLQKALASFIVDPIVTVTLAEPAPLDISVVGEVENTGAYSLVRPAGVLHALAAAGGLTQFADREGIYVLRRVNPALPPARIRFRYLDLISGSTRGSAFLLQRGDIIVVE